MSVSVTLAAGQPFMQWTLEIVTPSHLRDVDPFAHLLDQVQQADPLPGDPEVTCRVSVLLVASAALPSCLEPLRALVREVPFPQRSTGPVTFSVRAEDANRADHPFVGRVVSLICHDCIGNPNAASKSIILGTGAAPRRELLEPLLQRAFRQPAVDLHLFDFNAPRPLALLLESTVNPGARISAPTEMVTMVMKSLLKCEDDDAPEGFEVHFLTAAALPGLVQALREHPNHQYKSMSFFWSGEGPSDATDLCAAAMLCPRPSLRLFFYRFHFDNASRSPLIAEMDEVDRVPLERLLLSWCNFGPGAVPLLAKRPARELTLFSCVGGGVAELATTLAQTETLSTLNLDMVVLDVLDMARLCNILTAEGCLVSTLKIGGCSFGTYCLSYEAADHFFHDLPNMKSLRVLTCHHFAPIAQSRTILRGVDRNYGLREVSGLSFEAPDPEASFRLASEVASFAQANARGRGTVFASVQNPGSAALRGAALGAIHRLANVSRGDGDDDNGTSLYLCVRLFLPGVALAAAAGRAAAAAAPLEDSAAAAASTEREA
jgi:hypothetical protein